MQRIRQRWTRGVVPPLLAIALGLGAFPLAGCANDNSLEEAAQEVGDEVEDAADEVKDEIDDAT